MRNGLATAFSFVLVPAFNLINGPLLRSRAIGLISSDGLNRTYIAIYSLSQAFIALRCSRRRRRSSEGPRMRAQRVLPRRLKLALSPRGDPHVSETALMNEGRRRNAAALVPRHSASDVATAMRNAPPLPRWPSQTYRRRHDRSCREHLARSRSIAVIAATRFQGGC